jgi:hypothetical protein
VCLHEIRAMHAHTLCCQCKHLVNEVWLKVNVTSCGFAALTMVPIAVRTLSGVKDDLLAAPRPLTCAVIGKHSYSQLVWRTHARQAHAFGFRLHAKHLHRALSLNTLCSTTLTHTHLKTDDIVVLESRRSPWILLHQTDGHVRCLTPSDSNLQ